MSTFSRTVSSVSSVSCWGTTPSRPRIEGPSASGSRPRMRSVPAVTGETQPIIRIVELFPAPFGPRKPNASPRRTSRSMPSTATSSPNRLTSPRAWIMEPFSLTGPRYLARSDGLPRRLDVPSDLVDQLLLAREDLLVAQPPPQLDDEAPAVEVALEVEQVRLDPPLVTAVVRVEPDRDRGAMTERLARVDAVGRHEQRRLDRQVRSRVAEGAAALVAADDDPVELRRPPEQACRCRHLAVVEEAADLTRRDALEERRLAHVVAEPGEQGEVAAPLPAEAEPGTGDDDARVGEVRPRERLRLHARELEREVDHPRLGDSELRQQLQTALERRDQLDQVAPDDTARVRVERQRPHRQARLERGLDHPPVTQVHAVERADDDGDAHASRASACSAGTIRCSSASATSKGPISSRRSVAQCPPSADAIART